MNNENVEVELVAVATTAAEYKLARYEYGKQWRETNKEKMKAYRKENAPHLAALQRKMTPNTKHDWKRVKNGATKRKKSLGNSSN